MDTHTHNQSHAGVSQLVTEAAKLKMDETMKVPPHRHADVDRARTRQSAGKQVKNHPRRNVGGKGQSRTKA